MREGTKTIETRGRKFSAWTPLSPWFSEAEEKRVRRIGRPDREVEAVMREVYAEAKRKQPRPVGA